LPHISQRFAIALNTSDEKTAIKTDQKSSTACGLAVKPFLRRSIVVSNPLQVLLCITLVIVASAVSACKDTTDANSDIAAKVGSRNISLKQVDTVIKEQLGGNSGASLAPAELVNARLTVIDSLIQEEALYQKAQQENLVPDDSKVTQEIQRRKQEAGWTEEQYQTQLKQAGLTDAEFREKVMRDLAISELRERERTRINPPTDEEIRKYFDENRSQFIAERGADISIIVADPANNGGTPDDAIGDGQAENKINSIHSQLKSGADFATIASQRSEDQSALRGGNLGFGSEAALRQSFPTRPEIPARLMSMTAGQLTEPVKDNLSGRWVIFKVNGKREQAQNLTFEDVRKTIVDTITQQRQQVLLTALVMVSRSEANVKNYLAERILTNPQAISQMRPSLLLEQSGSTGQPQQQQPQPRIENQNQSPPAANANRPPTPSANSNRPR
jgi:parvulin-like peptidyl-prolyl isomerase